LAQTAGHDLDYIAYAGVLGMTGPPGGPVCPPGVQVGDLGGASFLGIGILAALYAAQRTGAGRRVEVAMYDAALAWTSIHAGELWATGEVPGPGDTLLNGKYPCYQVYACADGRWLAVGAVEPKFWAAFCAAVGRPDLEPRMADPSAKPDVAQVVAGRTRDEWMAVLGPADACVAPVLDLDEALRHPLAVQRGMVQQGRVDEAGTVTAPTLGTPIRFDGQVHPVGSPPPALGEHTVALASEAGLSEDEVDALLASGVLRQAQT
jgi:crotonobetainyl-CoA:carnitine CoA-transferase CaiB-like acyl-CoA transferase